MKIVSTKCRFDETYAKIGWLESEGLTILKVIDVEEIIPGVGRQTTGVQIMAYSVDDEVVTLLKLKYPSELLTFH